MPGHFRTLGVRQLQARSFFVLDREFVAEPIGNLQNLPYFPLPVGLTR